MSDAGIGSRRKRPGSASEAAGSLRDWTAIRTRFVTGRQSTREFAATEGIPYSSIAKRAASEKWDDAREAARTKIAAGVTKAAVKAAIESETEIDGVAHRVAMALARKLEAMVAGVESPGDAKDVAKAMADAHALARKTAHLSPEPAVAEANDAEGDIVIRRRDPDGDVVEVTSAGSPSPDRRPDGLPADADAVAVSSGPDVARQGDDRRAGERQDEDGR